MHRNCKDLGGKSILGKWSVGGTWKTFMHIACYYKWNSIKKQGVFDEDFVLSWCAYGVLISYGQFSTVTA